MRDWPLALGVAPVTGRTDMPSGDITVRSARREDTAAADLVFASAPVEFSRLAGSVERARLLLALHWSKRGHSVSYDCAWVAEAGGNLVGVLVAFPARQRLRRHALLVLCSVWRLPPSQWAVLTAALIRLHRLTPAPPADSFYAVALGVAVAHRRCGVASAMGRAVEGHAARAGFPRLAAHTGVRHVVARAGLAGFGFRGVAQRRDGYVLYVKDLRA